MQMDSADTASQIVFAGVRFALAGILVLIFASLREHKVLLPDRTVLKYAVPVCMAQTVCQYFFFYIGVAHTSGVKGAIITGLGNFIAILLSCLVFTRKNDRAKDAWLHPRFCRRGRDQSHGKFSGCGF